MLERLIGTVCAGLLIALPLVAQPQSSDKLAERYTGLAGSTPTRNRSCRDCAMTAPSRWNRRARR